MPALGEAIAAAPTRPSDTLAILYTSGTTGPSKGVCCPHAQFFWWGVNTAHLLGVGADDILCTTLPLFHTNALNTFFQALITGATAIFESRFSASAFFSTLAARRATVTYLLGAMVPILLSREAEPAEQAHRTRIALAPGVPGHFHAEFTKRTGIAILDGYGSTETNFVIGSPIAECKPGTMGRLFEGFDARVVDAEDNEVPDGTPGELMLRAAAPFAFATGYFGTPEKTVEAWRNLWFHTGDRVVREPDGYYKFVDRLKDAIRRRGENVSSFEVEQVLLSHPEIATAAAYPGALGARRRRGDGGDRAPARQRARRGRDHPLLRDAHALFRRAALPRVRRRPAGDGERQDPEVQAARTRHHRPDLGPRGRRHHRQAAIEITAPAGLVRHVLDGLATDMTEPRINRRAGEPVQPAELVDVAKLLAAYADRRPDPAVAAQRVAFGTSGHRGSSFSSSFNEAHVLAIAQAICHYRRKEGIDGPLFVGIDTHALSQPAFDSALEVLAANGVETMISQGGEYTPTPAVSQAILVHNRGRRDGLADGIVITPSHNPPEDGGFKYNPPNGGPADTDITSWIEKQANALLAERPAATCGACRSPRRGARACVHEYDFLEKLRRRPRQRDRLRRDPRLRHPHGRRSAGRRRRALLGAHRRALPHRSRRGQRPGRPDGSAS